jgi:hypothetical protein
LVKARTAAHSVGMHGMVAPNSNARCDMSAQNAASLSLLPMG